MRDLVLALVVAVVWVATAAAEPVRIFAVGHKLRLEDAVTYETFRDKMGALLDATHQARAGTVQPGVGDVASHLRPAEPSAPPPPPGAGGHGEAWGRRRREPPAARGSLRPRPRSCPLSRGHGVGGGARRKP